MSKNVYVDRPVLELGVYSAVLSYNDGNFGLKGVLECFGVQMGHCSLQLSTKRDARQVQIMNNETVESTKRARKRRRAIKKGLIDKEKETEPIKAYCAGGF